MVPFGDWGIEVVRASKGLFSLHLCQEVTSIFLSCVLLIEFLLSSFLP